MPKRLDDTCVVGVRYGSLTAIRFHGYVKAGDRNRMGYECVCDCGNVIVRTSYSLRGGCVKSCGCKTKELASSKLTKHGYSRTRVYSILQGIKARCLNPQHEAFSEYGGKGITVYQEWVDNPVSFIKYIGPPPSVRHSVDRWPDRNGNYEPGNVRWATPTQQANNRNNTFSITYNGETRPCSEWGMEKGIPVGVLRHRILTLGWSAEIALDSPYQKGKKYMKRWAGVKV